MEEEQEDVFELLQVVHIEAVAGDDSAQKLWAAFMQHPQVVVDVHRRAGSLHEYFVF